MITQDDEIHALTETLIYELVKAFALPNSELANRLIRLIFDKAAHATAKIGIGLDCAVAEGGLPAGARWLLPHFVKSHSACGVENIPATGPLVIASNHPASIDSPRMSTAPITKSLSVIFPSLNIFPM